MSRLARDVFETEFFHVIVQGLDKEYIFENERFKKKYIYDISNCKNEFDIKLLAYCVMDNHCHLLLHVPNVGAMGKFMKKVNTMFAQYYNFILNRTGYVFRDRYKSQAIYDDRYLMNCIAYIHNNPIKARYLSNAEEYRFSSYRDYMNSSGIVDFEDAKEFFDVTPENMQAIMRELGNGECDIDWIDTKEDEQSMETKAFKILSKYKIPPRFIKADRELLKKIVGELNEAKISGKYIASIFDCSAAFVSVVLKELKAGI